jgi:hypothetical protein
MFAHERHQLIDRDQKGNGINKSKQPQNDKTGQRIIISAVEKFPEEIFVRHRRGNDDAFWRRDVLSINCFRFGTGNELLKSRILSQRVPMPAQPEVGLRDGEVVIDTAWCR